MMKGYKNIGPVTMVTVAFIGPGTVTICILAGIKFGYSLLWAVSLSIVATIVLQEMAAKIAIFLILSAIVMGFKSIFKVLELL
jgi:manganese transport protein